MSESAGKIVITGGKGTLARAIATEFAERHWEVSSPGRDELDVRNEHAVAAFFRDRETDLLVCNAGLTRDKPLARLKPDDWEETWDVNFRGALRCARAALPSMIGKGAGHVVVISSYSALRPPVGQSAYAAAKAALLGLVGGLAREFGRQGIRANAVLPGFLETKMTEAVTERRRRQVLEEHALGRFNTSENTARFLRFLHEEMPDTSGQLFQLDSRPHGG